MSMLPTGQARRPRYVPLASCLLSGLIGLARRKQTRPDILSEFKEKVDMLQNEFPLSGTIGELAAPAIAEVFAV